MLSSFQDPLFYLPSGPKNLAALFPAIDFNDVDNYYLTLKTTADAILLTTNVMKTGCCCTDERVRVHFLNSLGAIDAVNFRPPVIAHKNASASYRKSLSSPLAKTDTGEERFALISNEQYEATTDCYGEADMPWLMELASTPKAWMEWKGVQGQADSFLPVRIDDGSYALKKIEDEWRYVFKIIFHLSNDNIHIRN